MPIAKRNRKVRVTSVTGTGSAQTVKHYLGASPSFVTMTPTESGVTDCYWTAATKTTVTVVITTGKVVKLLIER